MRKLEGKVGVITGGSSGIGLATARRFIEEGAHVFITGWRRSELDKAASILGRGVTTVQGPSSSRRTTRASAPGSISSSTAGSPSCDDRHADSRAESSLGE
ncbi:3-oxoacyl-[acyl-carrier protein] reductase [Labilithrix luteola]|uniref:3-oxoacyl-[acyl-carrier protein] reductase n=1 Tax=Labilithrix luteola TaxID=1391654 RepID=A0A0K1PNJ7_9BACT|nr:SDR family NAD(P)-dependent oxidoreductase [Labilithrix luteola]AKU95115.1 3-oxoacyl-[acyl-carrier protein] reductase [Labilithrix luteola]